jgi:hypothetical protein
MFRFAANEHDWELHAFMVLWLYWVKLATARLESRLQAVPLANYHVQSRTG